MYCCVWLSVFSIAFVRFIDIVLLIVDHLLLVVYSIVLIIFVCEDVPACEVCLCVFVHVKSRRQPWMDVIPHVPSIFF